MIGAVLMFTNLGSNYLWEDEGDTAALAVNILKFGVPKAWDGVSFLDSDKGARLNEELVMVSHPWLQYYLTAASFALFGENNCAARLPFALAGWLTILATYLCVYDLTQNRWTSVCSSALLTGSVQFLLFCRQCRYYPLSMFLGCLLVWIFFRMRSARPTVLFAVISILLFHSHPFGIVLVGALGLISFGCPSFASQRRFYCLASPAIAIFTLPWIALAHSGYAENSQLARSAAQFCGRLVQYVIECASVTPLVGIVILGLICALRWALQAKTGDPGSEKPQQELLGKNQSGLLLVTFVTLFCYDVTIASTESTDDLWHIGIRYTTAIMPLTAMAAAVLIMKISRARVAIWLSILLLFLLTTVAQMTPWIFWGRKVATFDGKEVIEAHLPRNYADRFLNTGYLLAFLRELRQENPGTFAKICQFLRENAKAGDVVITNYDWEPLYFYTRLPQALKVFPDYPIYQATKQKGLPDYVFDIDCVRWVIWRPIWDGYLGFFGYEVSRQILQGGAQVTEVAQFEETIWENRPEVHLHRFPEEIYFFTAPENYPRAGIYRVDWPDDINCAAKAGR